MELITWLIAAYGMSQILVYGSIFNGLRDGIQYDIMVILILF